MVFSNALFGITSPERALIFVAGGREGLTSEWVARIAEKAKGEAALASLDM